MSSTHPMRRIASIAGLALLTFAAPAGARAGAQYRIVDLGTLGGAQAMAAGITNTGEVYGVADFEPPEGPPAYEHLVFSWSPREGFVELGTFTALSARIAAVSRSGHVVISAHVGLGGNSIAYLCTRDGGLAMIAMPDGEERCPSPAAVNNAGVVVGFTCFSHAFSWTRRGGMVDLGTLGGSWSRAADVSGSRQIVGSSNLPGDDGSYHAMSWTAAGGMIDLGTLGGNDSDATAVNERGQVVGASETTSGGPIHAVMWTAAGDPIDLGTLGGPNSRALGVSDSGAVIGVADTADLAQHAFFWTPQVGMIDLGTIDGSSSVPVAVNPSGIVIGTSGDHAFAWSKRMGLVDLGEGSPRSINARGQIVGSRAGHAILWEPVGAGE